MIARETSLLSGVALRLLAETFVCLQKIAITQMQKGEPRKFAPMHKINLFLTSTSSLRRSD
jgi:hypothetical protein